MSSDAVVNGESVGELVSSGRGRLSPAAMARIEALGLCAGRYEDVEAALASPIPR